MVLPPAGASAADLAEGRRLTLNIMLPGCQHLRNVHSQSALYLLYTIPMCFLALLDMFQLIFFITNISCANFTTEYTCGLAAAAGQ